MRFFGADGLISDDPVALKEAAMSRRPQVKSSQIGVEAVNHR